MPITKNVVSGFSPDVFLNLADPQTTLAIWHRQSAIQLKRTVERLRELIFEIQLQLDPFSTKDQQQLTQELNSSTGYNCRSLADDILDLAKRYQRFSKTKEVRIRIETVRDNGCSRFHLDNVWQRLVCTYAGPGTQWVAPAFASAARERQSNYTGPLHSMKTGDAAFFSGKKSTAKNLIFHRSPPMKPNDPARVIAVIDGVYPC